MAEAPASPGVYLLYRADRLIYIGLAEANNTIRQCLQREAFAQELQPRLITKFQSRRGSFICITLQSIASRAAASFRSATSGEPVLNDPLNHGSAPSPAPRRASR